MPVMEYKLILPVLTHKVLGLRAVLVFLHLQLRTFSGMKMTPNTTAMVLLSTRLVQKNH